MNSWIAHVKQVAVDKGIPYVQALKVASESYKASPSKTTMVEEGSTTKKISKVLPPKGKSVRKDRKAVPKNKIDFSKIHWGEFTKDWKEMASPFESLYDFATDVVKRSSEYPAITVKRARFYKNVIMKGKGLGMCE